jgi:circadian clock protein KaiC
MRLLARDPLRYRRQILSLKEYFAGRACTVLLLDDNTTEDGDLQLQSLSHGVILLEQLPIEYGRARRRVRVVKYRGVAAVEGFHDFAIRKGGLVVFPQAESFDHGHCVRMNRSAAASRSSINCSAAASPGGVRRS